VSIYGSYRQINTGVSLFWTTLYEYVEILLSTACDSYRHTGQTQKQRKPSHITYGLSVCTTVYHARWN